MISPLYYFSRVCSFSLSPLGGVTKVGEEKRAGEKMVSVAHSDVISAHIVAVEYRKSNCSNRIEVHTLPFKYYAVSNFEHFNKLFGVPNTY